MATWDYAAERWLASREDAKWIEKDRGYIARLNEYLSGKRLDEITAAVVADVRDKLRATRANGTVNRIMGVLNTILNLACEEWQLIGAAPRVKKLKENERVRWLTPEEAANLLQALPKRIRPIVQLALATGLRESNILNLEWNEINMSGRSLAIPGTKMKNGENFGAPLNDAAIAVLAKQKGKHPRWVFPRVWGGVVGPLRAIDNGMWQAACERAGITDFHFHDLRHTWASWHLQTGTHMLALMQLGGWKDEKMVKRYAHLATGHLAGAATNIGELCLSISPAKMSRTNSRSASSKLES